MKNKTSPADITAPDLAWLHRHAWLAADELDTELLQAEQEGRDLSKARAKFAALKKPAREERDAAWFAKYRELSAEVQTLPTRKGYAYEEPSDLPGILAARGKPTAELKPYRGSYPHFCERLNAGWVGRICGCLLGKPVEGWRSAAIIAAAKATGNWPLSAYLQYPNARAKQKLPGADLLVDDAALIREFHDLDGEGEFRRDDPQAAHDLADSRRADYKQRFLPARVADGEQKPRQAGDVVGVKVRVADHVYLLEAPAQELHRDLGALAGVDHKQPAVLAADQGGQEAVRQGHHAAGAEEGDVKHGGSFG